MLWVSAGWLIATAFGARQVAGVDHCDEVTKLA